MPVMVTLTTAACIYTITLQAAVKWVTASMLQQASLTRKTAIQTLQTSNSADSQMQ